MTAGFLRLTAGIMTKSGHILAIFLQSFVEILQPNGEVLQPFNRAPTASTKPPTSRRTSTGEWPALEHQPTPDHQLSTTTASTGRQPALANTDHG